jgi:hypothetical protein
MPNTACPPKFVTILKKWCLSLVLTAIVFIFGSSDAWACGDLLLASQGVDFGKLSCDANGYVVLNPNSSTNLLGFSISSETVKGKNAVAGAPFQFTPNGRIQVVEKLTGSSVTRFRCKQSANGIASILSSNPASGTDFIIAKVAGSSQEMTTDTLEICAARPIPQDDYRLYADYAVFDMDNDLLANGHTLYTQLGGADWAKPKKVSAYFAKDNSSVDRTLQVSIYQIGTPGNDTLLGSQSLYDIKSTVPAFSPSSYEVTLDYRYDPSNKINARLRGLLEGVAAEFRALLKENSKSNYSGNQFTADSVLASAPPDTGLPTRLIYALTEGYDTTTGTPLPASIQRTNTSIINEFFDDMTIYVSPLLFLETPSGTPIAGASVGLLAQGSERVVFAPPSFYSSNAHTPYMGNMRLNVDNLAGRSDEYIRAVFRHEMIHIFGGVNIRPYPAGSTINDKTDGNGNYIGSKVLANNGNTSILMDVGSPHFADSVSTSVQTLMRKTGNYPTTAIALIDKAVMADNGFCVVGINDTPSCN